MLKLLKQLVFGHGNYEKAKIELRFFEIEKIIPNIKITQISDFEDLEESIYKIKELLRVKSSNLNKAIRAPNNKLTKKKVLDILKKLDKIKYDFLNEAFSILCKTNNLENNNIDYKNNKVDENYKSDNNLVEEKLEQKIFNFNYNNYSIVFNLEKIPYLKIYFKEKIINFIVLKKLLSIFFDILTPKATNIIIEGQKALIVFRDFDDELFDFSRFVKKDINMDEIFEKLVLNRKDISSNLKINDEYIEVQNSSDLKKLEHNKTSLDDLVKKEIENPNFINTVSKEDILKDEENLEFIKDDPVVLERRKKSLFDKGIIIEKENNTVDGRKEDKILEDKKESNNILNNNLIKENINNNSSKKYLEIAENENLDDERKFKKSSFNDDKQFDSSIEREENLGKNQFESKLNPIEENSKKDNQNQNIQNTQDLSNNIKYNKSSDIDNQYLVYSDDIISVYFENLKLPNLVIELNNSSLNRVNESDLSYAFIFTKLFASVLFDIFECAGTNIIYDNSSNKIRVIPRFIDDNISFNWNSLNLNNETLEKIRDDLISVMNYSIMKENNNLNLDINNKLNEKKNNELGNNFENNNSTCNSFEKNIEDKLLKTKSLTQNLEGQENESNFSKDKSKENIEDERLDDIKKKAEYILESLKRIP